MNLKFGDIFHRLVKTASFQQTLYISDSSITYWTNLRNSGIGALYKAQYFKLLLENIYGHFTCRDKFLLNDKLVMNFNSLNQYII